MTEEFAVHVKQERDRLTKKRESIEGRRAKLDEELSEVDTALSAIDAYETTLIGKPVKVKGASRKGAVLEIIKKHPDGIGRSGILEELGLKGDKRAEQSVSNSLGALKKAGTIDNPNGIYVAA